MGRFQVGSRGLADILLTSAAIIWVTKSIVVARHTWNDINFDALSYIGIARHIAHGDFSGSINGYWSPLLSWILALGSGSSPILQTARLFSVAAFAAAAILLYILSRTLWHSEIAGAAAVLWFVLSGHIVADSVDFIGADLLFATLVAGYFFFVLKCYERETDGCWFGVGLMFAFAFLAKGFALPWLLLTTVFLLAQIHWKDRKGLLRHASLAFVLPLVVWAGWSLVLQTKYHRFISGYQFRHQVASLMLKRTWTPPGPEPTTLIDQRPFVDEYLVVDPIPPDSSLWTVKLSTTEVTRRLVRNEARNLLAVIRPASILWSPGGWVAVVFCGWALWKRRDPLRFPFLCIVFFSGAALVSGYGLMAIESRYLLPIAILVLALGSRVLVPPQWAEDDLQIPPGVTAITWVLILATALFLLAYRSSPVRSRDSQMPYRDIGAVLHANPGQVVSYGVPPDSAVGIGWEAGYYASFFGGQRLVGYSASLPTRMPVAAVCADLNMLSPRSVLVWGSPNNSAYVETLQAVNHCGYSAAAKARDSIDGEIGTLLRRDNFADSQ